MRRQKTPQKPDGKLSESTDVSTAAVTVTDAPSVSAVRSLTMPSASAVAPSQLPVDAASSTVSAAAALPVTDASMKPKTPQTRKARSRIAANFGALNSQS